MIKIRTIMMAAVQLVLLSMGTHVLESNQFAIQPAEMVS